MKTKKKFRFEDFCIDQFVDYIENNNDVNHNGHANERSSGSVRQQHMKKYKKNQHLRQQQKLSSSKEFFYKCTVCREIVNSGAELLRHVRTHTRYHSDTKNFYNDKVSERKTISKFFPHDSHLFIAYFKHVEILGTTKMLHLFARVRRRG